MQVDVLTLFPDMYPGVLGHSIIGRALKSGKFELNAIDLRNFAHDKHKSVDDKIYGDGPGMLMKVDVLHEAILKLRKANTLVVLTTPRGKVFDQEMASSFTKYEHILLVAGHYEGVDQRVIDRFIDLEISIGDFVLTNGNLAAMVIIDAFARLLTGVLGDEDSFVEESHSNNLLEYNQYTRPNVFDGMEVPEILKSGNRAKIEAYRRGVSERLTRERRPDLWLKYLKAMEAKNDNSR